jgi:hypothetical protein
MGQISKFGRIGRRPHVKRGVHDIITGEVSLAKRSTTPDWTYRRQVVAKVVDHRSPIMRDQDSVFFFRTVQQDRIGNTGQVRLLRR